MTREQYLKQRQELLNQAEKSIQEGNLEDFNGLKSQIENLDNQFESESKAQANLQALSNNAIVSQANAINAVMGNSPAVIDKSNINESKISTYENAFTKFLMGKSLSNEEKNVFNQVNSVENSAEKNSYLIPTTWLSQIWSEAQDRHPVLGHVKATSVPGDLDIPKADIDSDGSFYDEDTEVTSGTIKDSDIHLKGYECAKLISVSWKLQKMAVPDFQAWLRRMISIKVSNTKANSYFTGRGVASSEDDFKSEPYGVITALKNEADTPQILSVGADSKVSYESITYLVSLVHSDYAKNSKFYANNNFIWRILSNITDNDGKPIFIPDPSGQVLGRVFGFEVCEESAVPNDNLVFGNFEDCYACNNQQDITLYTQDTIKSRKTDYMAYTIYDSQPITTKAFALLIKETE